MIKITKILPLLTFIFLFGGHTYAQEAKIQKADVYVTGGLEIIFSGNTGLQMAGQEINGGVLRFAPVFNWQSLINFDFSPRFGLYTGFGIRNVGMIFDVPSEFVDSSVQGPVRKKVRTYNLGIPVGFKVGNLHGLFFYGGYEFEIPVQYKEKTFVSERKDDRFSVWFTDRVNLQHSLMLGVQFPYGTNLKFKYYLNDYFNSSWGRNQVNMKGTNLSYNQITGNVFYVSLNINLFRNTKFYFSEYEKKHTFPQS
ncbi:hypothetical protein KMW28_01405 [Flammeovirga yaeyamensis]|uniref:Outer membrane protein beta-barrel domain-containing protein n=1 Tax=Flammeovirga yaeyamensis TaxID=367791 RepID=A0AAX1N4Z8_9BACT|nr:MULTISPECIES: hypothetical protein [Flammeovirga]ANQ50305.1 hypothetical protein MY04_2937 [Flammeovirga sp. MY04]MBB3699741.1 hypothetical protein [Flammeovirga yaeyamensis]NMF36689.1 hypothetical protein [Flammeovirga yaeyamensis]QWG02267.1 hypothetical protein KMW28_01405 [Flammeovirga yaeyamensis]